MPMLLRKRRYASFCWLSLMLGTMTSCYANVSLNEMQTLLQKKQLGLQHQNPLSEKNRKNETNEQNKKTQRIQSPYTLVIFYRSTCPHCQRFDPIVRAYADQHSIPVMAYTTDGGVLPAFPRSLPATPALMMTYFPGSSQRVVPTLFLQDQHQHIFPVSVGEMSYSELSHRMHTLLDRVNRYETAHGF